MATMRIVVDGGVNLLGQRDAYVGRNLTLCRGILFGRRMVILVCGDR